MELHIHWPTQSWTQPYRQHRNLSALYQHPTHSNNNTEKTSDHQVTNGSTKMAENCIKLKDRDRFLNIKFLTSFSVTFCIFLGFRVCFYSQHPDREAYQSIYQWWWLWGIVLIDSLIVESKHLLRNCFYFFVFSSYNPIRIVVEPIVGDFHPSRRFLLLPRQDCFGRPQ